MLPCAVSNASVPMHCQRINLHKYTGCAWFLAHKRVKRAAWHTVKLIVGHHTKHSIGEILWYRS